MKGKRLKIREDFKRIYDLDAEELTVWEVAEIMRKYDLRTEDVVTEVSGRSIQR